MRKRNEGCHEAQRRVCITFSFLALMGLSAMTKAPAAAVSGRHSHLPQAIAGPCVTPDINLSVFVDSLVAGNDSVWMVQRQSFQLPAVPVSSVVVVTDTTICHRAAVATGLARTTPDSTAVPSVEVLRVGSTRYVVRATGFHVGEFGVEFTFDTAFTVPPLASWAF